MSSAPCLPVLMVPAFHNVQPISRKAQMVTLLRQALLAITQAAERHGWETRSVHRSTGKRSYYLKLEREGDGRVTIRVSDHTPGYPLGGGKGRVLLCIIGVHGSLEAAIRWLARPAVEGGAQC